MLCIEEYSSLINCSERQYVLASDPKALAVNGITLEEVVNAKMHNEVCEDLTDMFLANDIHKSNAVFICQNPSFDRIFFNQIMPVETQEELELPYHWLDLASMYFARSLNVENPVNGHNLPHLIRLSKDSIASYLGIPPEKKPHRATNGVHHLIECYTALMYNRPLK
jgi:DNA polymerase-3 subunit epsilon/oligoribonuclease